MDLTLFRDAKLKIKRANQHIEELKGLLDTYLQSDFYSSLVKDDAKKGTQTLKFTFKPLPEDVPLVLGDAMQNLRTVLDYMVFDIVSAASGSTKYVKFPARYDDRHALEAACNGGEIKVAGADIITLICDVIQPYPGGYGAALHVLHGLNITEKHLHLIPIVAAMGLTNVSLITGQLFMDGCDIAAPPGRLEMDVFQVPANLAWQGKAQPIADILFRKGDPFEGESVIPTLEQLSKLIAGTLQAVENVLVARGQGATHNAPPSA